MEKKSLRWVSYNDKFYYNSRLCYTPEQAYGGTEVDGVIKCTIEYENSERELIDIDTVVDVITDHPYTK